MSVAHSLLLSLLSLFLSTVFLDVGSRPLYASFELALALVCSKQLNSNHDKLKTWQSVTGRWTFAPRYAQMRPNTSKTKIQNLRPPSLTTFPIARYLTATYTQSYTQVIVLFSPISRSQLMIPEPIHLHALLTSTSTGASQLLQSLNILPTAYSPRLRFDTSSVPLSLWIMAQRVYLTFAAPSS